MRNFLGNKYDDEKIDALNKKFEKLIDKLVEGEVLDKQIFGLDRYSYFYVSFENRRLKSRVASLENRLSLLLNHLDVEFNHVEPHLEIRKKEK